MQFVLLFVVSIWFLPGAVLELRELAEIYFRVDVLRFLPILPIPTLYLRMTCLMTQSNFDVGFGEALWLSVAFAGLIATVIQ